MAEEASVSEVQKKIIEYETFINEKLKKDLSIVHKAQDDIYVQTAEYLQLKNVIEMIQTLNLKGKELKSQVDLGCNFFCQAKVSDTSRIFVCVGYGFFVEFTLDEALEFIKKKCEQLRKKSEKLGRDSAKIKAHIKMLLEGLRELQSLGEVKTAPYYVW